MSQDHKYYYYYYGERENKPNLNIQDAQMMQLRAWLENNRNLIRGQWSPFGTDNAKELTPVDPQKVTDDTLIDSGPEFDFDDWS